MLKIKPGGKLSRKPERHPGRRNPDDREFDPRDFLDDVWPNFCQRMFGIREFARGLAFQYSVGSQHRHRRTLQSLVERLDCPIELMIANDPRVVFKMIE